MILRGKNNPNYQPNKIPTEKVVIANLNKIKYTGKKKDQKIYYHYSGYPGGMKSRKLKSVLEKNPERVLRLAVYRMLAPNKLRDLIIKNLEIK